MRYALISLIRKDPQLQQFCGLSAVADGNVALSQIDLAKRNGVEHILCLVETVPKELAEIARYAQSLDMKWTIVRSSIDISARVAGDDELLLIADGLFIAPDQAQRLANERGSFIVTFSPGDNEKAITDKFERMDINHIWAGVAMIRGADLFDIRTLPADWDAQSAVLRIAIQKQYRRITWPVRLLEQARVHLVVDDADNNKIFILGLPDKHENQGMVAWSGRSKIGRRLATKIWTVPSAKFIVRGFAIASALLAIVAAIYGWTATGLVFLLGACAFGTLPTILFQNFLGFRESGYVQTGQNVLNAVTFLALLLWSKPLLPWSISLFVGLVAIGLHITIRSAKTVDRFPVLIPVFQSASLFLLGAIIAAVFGLLLQWTMLWALLNMGISLVRTWPVKNALETEG